MEKIGYKCFNKDMTNRYGNKFEIGHTYSVSGEIKFGNSGNGFHFCTNFEDCFRYFSTFDEEISLCLVKGYGNISCYNDEYYGFYDMFCSSNIEIIKEISREEIIQMALHLNEIRICRFIQLFKLNNNEKNMILEKFKKNKNVLFYMNYYQDNKVLKKYIV